MGWKDWSYWLRGGVIGLIIGIILLIIGYILPLLICPDFFRVGPVYPTNQPICFSLISNPLRTHAPFPTILLPWIIFILILALLGSLIGFIVGKIKQK